MGLFSGRAKTAWEKARKRAEKAERNGLLVDAQFYYTEAAQAAPEEHKQALEAKVRECGKRVYRMHIDAAAELADMGQHDKAAERYELAKRFATGADQHAQADASLRQLAARRMEMEESEEWPEDQDVDEPKLDQEHAFLMAIGVYPEALADRYQELGDDFRDAFMAFQRGHAEEALAYFEEAARDSDEAILHHELGHCYLALGRTDEAIEAHSRAEALEPDWIEVKLALAEACWTAERWELAERALERALDVDDEDERIYFAVCRTALLTRTPDYGIEAADVILQKNPIDSTANVLKGQLLELKDRTQEAVACYELVIKRTWRYDHDRDELVFDRNAGLLAAVAYLKLESQLERAEELLRATLTVTAPTQRWQVELLLGETLVKAGRRQEAEDLLHHTALDIPESEPMARLRAYDLVGRQEDLDRLLSTLDDAQVSAWNEAKAAQR